MQIPTLSFVLVVLATASAEFNLPDWYLRLDAFFEDMQTCHKRDAPPEEGSICSRTPKTCCFGTQKCSGGIVHPEVECHCSGKPGQKWSCQPMQCPSVTGGAEGAIQNGASSSALAMPTTASALATLKSIDEAVRQIIVDDDSMAATFIRLTFHDCVPNGPDGGGCDGCINLSNPSNRGLAKATNALAPVVEAHKMSEEVSRADIWMFAGMVASKVSQTQLNFTDDFKIGRRTCEVRGTCSSDDPLICATNGPDVHEEYPTTDMHTHEIFNFFGDHFGFDMDQTVALLGVHTVGKATRTNSGYNGPFGWDPDNKKLDNEFYKQLVGDANSLEDAPADLVLILNNNSDLRPVPGIDDEHQWVQNVTTADGEIHQLLMFNSDVALVRDMGQLDEGQTCDFKTPVETRCPIADSISIVGRYSEDNNLWLSDFKSVLQLMIEKNP